MLKMPNETEQAPPPPCFRNRRGHESKPKVDLCFEAQPVHLVSVFFAVCSGGAYDLGRGRSRAGDRAGTHSASSNKMIDKSHIKTNPNKFTVTTGNVN